MRLYLSAGEDNYIEFAPDEIAAFETGSRSAGSRRRLSLRRLRIEPQS